MTALRPGITAMRAIALGSVSDHEYINKFGRNADVDATAAQEDVWAGGGLYTGFPSGTVSGAAETVSVSSTSTADAAAGTGLRTLRIEGLSSAGLTQTEDLSLNGTTAVTSTKTWYRVFRAFGLTAGSGGTNAGTITVKHSVTTANVFVVMNPGFSSSHIAAYTVPANRTGLITNATVTVSNAVQTEQEITGGVVVRPYQTGCWRVVNPTNISTSSALSIAAEGGILLPPLTDVTFRVLSATADNLTVTASFALFLFP